MEEEAKEEEKEDKNNNSTIFIYTMGAVALVIGYVFMQLNMMSQQKKTD